jgi:hypothetical protein
MTETKRIGWLDWTRIPQRTAIMGSVPYGFLRLAEDITPIHQEMKTVFSYTIMTTPIQYIRESRRDRRKRK